MSDNANLTIGLIAVFTCVYMLHFIMLNVHSIIICIATTGQQGDHQDMTPVHEAAPSIGSNRLSSSSKELLNGPNKSPAIEKYTRYSQLHIHVPKHK